MTTYTRADMAERVLRDLGLVAAEEPVSAADLSFVEETIESVFGELSLVGIFLPNASEDSIPHEIYAALSKRIGLDVAPAFGLVDAAQAEIAKPIAERRLRELSMAPATGAVAEATYF